MKTKIEVICGFLESGKTSLIQHILQFEEAKEYKKIVLIQCEEGVEEFAADTMKSLNISLKKADQPNRIDRPLFQEIKKEYEPDLILIEYNGVWEISNLLRTQLPKNYFIDKIWFCADASTFEMYLKNTGTIMAEQISNCDAVFFNRCDELNTENIKSMEQSVKNMNRSVNTFFCEPYHEDIYIQKSINIDSEELKKQKHIQCAVIAMFTLACIYLILIQIPNSSNFLPILQNINTVFIGILLQAVPFILIGVFVSSILQVFIPDKKLVRLFTKHRWLGFPLAVILGVCFPVCDCAMVPVASRMVQKGVPLPQAITFLLAAPAVSPVVIVSTLYAFPGQPKYAVCRILLGIIIALIVGLVLTIINVEANCVLKNSSVGNTTCANGYLGSMTYSGTLGKLEAVFRHAGMEFLNTVRFIIFGALVSSILQTILPSSLFKSTGLPTIVPILIMLLASFLMSVCSNSNAFIGRSFLSTFPAGAVMGFIVMGPMLDIKNLFMLTGSFQKKFVLKLTAILFTTAFAVFTIFSALALI